MVIKVSTWSFRALVTQSISLCDTPRAGGVTTDLTSPQHVSRPRTYFKFSVSAVDRGTGFRHFLNWKFAENKFSYLLETSFRAFARARAQPSPTAHLPYAVMKRIKDYFVSQSV
ncbi:hypothetical protein EVAR_48469_1 [Eumeta japonica]|uniref:Uncharacterized protein n=1 Tax=Eumeta variegata TaxID=151549 RepID=A0A4C1XEI6_EUMVA|nr:hypothetical protein EVAR_48469_1 [Eumeta japonica]